MVVALPREHIYTYVKVNDTLEKKQYVVKDIQDLINRLQKLNTGDNGI